MPTPWGAILTSLPVLSLVLAETGHDWGFYTMVTDLPTYMANVQHYDIASVSSPNANNATSVKMIG